MTKWRNTSSSWGLLAITMHWLVAASIIGLFGLGFWMVGLDYYDPWYKQGPDIHRSIGVLLFFLILLRLLWRMREIVPAPHPNHKPWEIQAAHAAHLMLYLLPVITMISGYLISTADGRAVSVFGWFEVPALITGINQQEELMGDIHEILAWALILTAAVHAAGALKHHVIDRDTTLLRMLGKNTKEETTG